MNRMLAATLAGAAITMAGLAVTTAPASAAPKPCVARSLSSHPAQQEASAWCADGSAGEVRVRIVCMSESTFKTYTKYGPWVYDAGTKLSTATCRGLDALVSHAPEKR